MQNIIDNLKTLESKLSFIYEILNERNSWTYGDISDILHQKDAFWNAFYEAYGEGKYNEICDILGKNDGHLFDATDVFSDAYKIFCEILSDCDYCNDSDLLKLPFKMWFRYLCKKSLNEIESLIKNIESGV